MVTAKFYARWVVFLPAAFAGAYAAWFVVRTVNLLTVPDYIPELMSQLFIEAMSSACMGVGFIYAGTRTAPAYHKHVSLLLSGIGLVLILTALFFAMQTSNYWAMWATTCTGLGIAITTMTIVRDERLF